jgi:hypothetical protein
VREAQQTPRVDDDFSVPLVRIMSYALVCDNKGRPLEDQKEKLRFARLREICARFLDAGLAPVYEYGMRSDIC